MFTQKIMDAVETVRSKIFLMFPIGIWKKAKGELFMAGVKWLHRTLKNIHLPLAPSTYEQSPQTISPFQLLPMPYYQSHNFPFRHWCPICPCGHPLLRSPPKSVLQGDRFVMAHGFFFLSLFLLKVMFHWCAVLSSPLRARQFFVWAFSLESHAFQP